MNINNQIKLLPESLQLSVQQQWQSFVESGVDISSLPDEVLEVLPKIWACSDFVMQTCVRFPELFLELACSDLINSYADGLYKKSISIE